MLCIEKDMNMKIKNIRIISLGLSALIIAGISPVTVGGDRSSEVVYAAEGEVQGVATEGDADQIYCIGSVSKVYVTTAVMQLVEQGKVDLDAPVTDYIDDFKMADERYKDITVRMLMNHTSEIFGSSLKNSDLYGDNSSVSTENTLKNLENQRLKADPGEYAAYCNDGFTLLELLVERVSGMSYTDYVEKNIAGKIGAENIYTAKNVF